MTDRDHTIQNVMRAMDDTDRAWWNLPRQSPSTLLAEPRLRALAEAAIQAIRREG